MVDDYKSVLGILAAIIGIVAFVPYYRDIFRGTTKPHLFTWSIFSLLLSITFLIQVSEGGGAGAWATGVEALCCLGVAGLAFHRGEKNIKKLDWICFFAALIAIALWLFADQPLIAIMFVVSADALGFFPTFRKSYNKPHEETATNYALGAARWPLAILALQSLTPVNWLYPAAIALLDLALVAMLLIRRRQLKV